MSSSAAVGPGAVSSIALADRRFCRNSSVAFVMLFPGGLRTMDGRRRVSGRISGGARQHLLANAYRLAVQWLGCELVERFQMAHTLARWVDGRTGGPVRRAVRGRRAARGAYGGGGRSVRRADAADGPPLTVVMDGSGSMWGKIGAERLAKFQLARQGLAEALPKLPANDAARARRVWPSPHRLPGCRGAAGAGSRERDAHRRPARRIQSERARAGHGGSANGAGDDPEGERRARSSSFTTTSTTASRTRAR